MARGVVAGGAVLQRQRGIMFLRVLIFVGVGEGEGGGREAVEIDAAVGEQAEGAHREGAADFGAVRDVERILAIGVALGPGGGAADPVGADIAAADRELRGAERRRAELAVQAHGVARAIFGGNPPRRAVVAVGIGQGGGDRDDAADRLAAPGEAVRAAQQLNTVDAADHQIGEIEAAGGRRRVADADAVDDDERLFGLGAANAQVGDAAQRAVLRQADARQPDEQVGRRAVLRALEIGAVDQRPGGVGAVFVERDPDHRDRIVVVTRAAGFFGKGRRRGGERQQRQGGSACKILHRFLQRNGLAVTRGTSPATGAPRPLQITATPGQVSWLAGSSENAAFPGPKPQWHVRIPLAGHSCGGSAGLAPDFPFHPRCQGT